MRKSKNNRDRLARLKSCQDTHTHTHQPMLSCSSALACLKGRNSRMQGGAVVTQELPALARSGSRTVLTLVVIWKGYFF